MAAPASDKFLVSEAHLSLERARQEKAERTKTLGEPLQLAGQALALELRGNVAWIAENTNMVRKIDLETGKTLQLFKGHTGPVASIAFCDKVSRSGEEEILISGSWDKSIRIWNSATAEQISSTPNAHTDFVKSFHVLPRLRLLISGGSDTIVRFWDLSEPTSSGSLNSLGSISSHTRPVECLDGESLSDTSAILYTGDTMGVIKVWDLRVDASTSSALRWTTTLLKTINNHRTRINELRYGGGYLWTASADETAQVLPQPEAPKPPKPLTHPVAVRAILPLALTGLGEPYLLTAAGDVLRTYDVSELDDPRLLSESNAHWHDVTAIRLWMRKSVGDDARTRVEPWIITASLDKTIRKWKLSELIQPPPVPVPVPEVKEPKPEILNSELTEEEERELAELMEED